MYLSLFAILQINSIPEVGKIFCVCVCVCLSIKGRAEVFIFLVKN